MTTQTTEPTVPLIDTPSNEPAPQSIHDIVLQLEHVNSVEGLPLGNPPTEPTIPAQLPPTSTIPPSTFTSQADDLLSDIEGAKLEEAAPKSIASFDGLKARYKNKVQALKDEFSSVSTQLQKLQSENAELSKLKEVNDEYTHLQNEVATLKETLKEYEQELDTTRYYRMKYDFENDPYVRNEYIKPMQDIKDRALDIIENAGKSPEFWSELTSLESEYAINNALEQAGLSTLNASTMRDLIARYNRYSRDLSQVSKPEVIDAELSRLRGKGKADIDSQATKVFEDIYKDFSTHIEQFQKSSVNKEHNIFVMEKVTDTAKKTFDAFKADINPDSLTPGALRVLAQSALVTAAYPYQSKLSRFLLEKVDELTKALEESTSTPGISQVREPLSTPSSSLTREQLQATTPDLIVQGLLNGEGSFRR